jgi:hypothetical protein
MLEEIFQLPYFTLKSGSQIGLYVACLNAEIAQRRPDPAPLVDAE